MGHYILRLLMETGPPFYVVIRATRGSSRHQGKGRTFISQLFLRPWVLVRPRESNPWPPALQSSALPTELILPRLANPTAGGKRSRKSCFPARVGCLAWKLERFYSLSGILHQGAPEPRIAFLPSLVSAWETFHVKNYAPRALALSAWHEREPADRKQNIQRRAWKSKWGWQLSIFVQFPAQSTCPLEAIIMADKADSQDLKSKAKEITKVSRNHYESLK